MQLILYEASFGKYFVIIFIALQVTQDVIVWRFVVELLPKTDVRYFNELVNLPNCITRGLTKIWHSL